MDVTTTPVKWESNFQPPKDPSKEDARVRDKRESEVRERARRTKVAVLDFVTIPNGTIPNGTKVRRKDCENPKELAEALSLPQDKRDDVTARLYVVEDLSSDMIEALGAKFDIDPLFFRNQMGDYMWNNPRDEWVDLPSLDAVSRKRSFFSIRYFQPRYFRSEKSYNEGITQMSKFNVLRRMDNNRPWEGTPLYDTRGSDVGLVRSKMSLWVRQNAPNESIVLGILLVDPTIKAGYRLWGGYQNFETCPSMNDMAIKKAQKLDPFISPPRTSIFEEVIYWTSKLQDNEILTLPNNPRIFVKKALLIVCAEWRILAKYLTTRMTQLEWELDDVDKGPPTRSTQNVEQLYPFRHPKGLEESFNALNKWKRRMPVYQEWITETLNHIITREDFMGSTSSAISELKDDFLELQSALTEVIGRSDRIQSSVANIVSITENKKAIRLNQIAMRLTYLAVVFVPMTFVSGLFSMQADVTQLKMTFWVYFACAVPLTILAFIVLGYVTIRQKLVLGYTTILEKVKKLRKKEAKTV